MKKLLSAVGLCCITTAVHAQENPQPGYKDSYAVDGVCYCDSNFDHGIANINISTPIGNRTVRQVCDDIEDALGTGRSSGRALYNDIIMTSSVVTVRLTMQVTKTLEDVRVVLI